MRLLRVRGNHLFSRWLFLMLMLFSCLSNATLQVISLGKNCQVAAFLKRSRLRREAYPFDWLTTSSFEGFMKALEEDFAYFLHPDVLIRHERFIQNTYSMIYFLHDFPTISQNKQDIQHFDAVDSLGRGVPIITDFLSVLPLIQQKYDRRIKRLRTVLNGQEPVIFIRSNMIPDEAHRLANFLEKRYPQLDFTLVAPYDRTRGMLGDADWYHPRIRAFFMGNPVNAHSFKRWDDMRWHTLFKELGLISATSVFQKFIIE